AVRSGPRAFAANLLDMRIGRPGLATLSLGLAVAALAGALELLNPHNYWILFEDISCGVTPIIASLAVFITAFRGEPQYRRIRMSLAASLGMTGIGQSIACVPDMLGRSIGAFGAVSEVCYVIGALLGMTTLLVGLYGKLRADARRAILLDGLLIMAASVTFVFANWLHQSFLPGSQ